MTHLGRIAWPTAISAWALVISLTGVSRHGHRMTLQCHDPHVVDVHRAMRSGDASVCIALCAGMLGCEMSHGCTA